MRRWLHRLALSQALFICGLLITRPWCLAFVAGVVLGEVLCLALFLWSFPSLRG